MSIRILVATAAALLAMASAASATVITGTYTATATTGSGQPSVSDDLSSPFTETLTAGGAASTPTAFIAVAPQTYGSGTKTGSVTVDFSFSGLTVSGVSSTGNTATINSGKVQVLGYYSINYSATDDCITWAATSCVAGDNNNSLGDTIAINFSNGEVLDVNLYNWADWTMYPDISFKLVSVPEPASLAVFGVALAGIGLMKRRRPAGFTANAAPTRT